VPYGYTRWEIAYLMRGSGESRKVENEVPWTYISHKFILSSPPRSDPRLLERHPEVKDVVKNGFPGVGFINPRIVDPHIGWPVVAIQAALAILISCGLVLMLRGRRT
jgi:hypothetical protein